MWKCRIEFGLVAGTLHRPPPTPFHQTVRKDPGTARLPKDQNKAEANRPVAATTLAAKAAFGGPALSERLALKMAYGAATGAQKKSDSAAAPSAHGGWRRYGLGARVACLPPCAGIIDALAERAAGGFPQWRPRQNSNL